MSCILTIITLLENCKRELTLSKKVFNKSRNVIINLIEVKTNILFHYLKGYSTRLVRVTVKSLLQRRQAVFTLPHGPVGLCESLIHRIRRGIIQYELICTDNNKLKVRATVKPGMRQAESAVQIWPSIRLLYSASRKS